MANSLTTTPLTPRPGATETFTSGVGLALPLNLKTGALSATLELTYTPDRDVVTPQALHTWLQKLNTQQWENAETFVQTATDAFYNAVLPRTVTVELSASTTSATGTLHQKVSHTCSQPAK